MGNLQKILVGESEGKRPLERPSCRWEYVAVKAGGYGVRAESICFRVASKDGIL